MFTNTRKVMLLMMLLGGVFFAQGVHAQSEEDNVLNTIKNLFDGMREADSAKVHRSFSDEAVVKTVGRNREGKSFVQMGNLQTFLNTIGTPRDEPFNEKILSHEIKVDGPMATAWIPYEFSIGETFYHCGVNSFTLFKEESGWKIIHLIDTRRREGCK